jgi:hypothetical protein
MKIMKNSLFCKSYKFIFSCTFFIVSTGFTHLSAQAQPIDLRGEIKCGPSNSGVPGYSQPLNLRLKDDYAFGLNESDEIIENQELIIFNDGMVNYSAAGMWKNQPHRRWRIYGTGMLDGSFIQVSGSMYGNSAAELVRSKCDIKLESSTKISLPQNKAVGYKIDTTGPALGVSPSSINGGLLFREWALERGLPWSAQVKPAGVPREIGQRNPSFMERSLIAEAANVIQQTKAKAMIFIDDGKVVASIARPNIKPETLLPSASISKTVTALGVGKAICEGKLEMNATAESLVASLQGTAIGKSSLRDILLMSSGSAETLTQPTHGITYEETRRHLWNPASSVRELISSSRISGSKSGSPAFDYKSTDPYLAALMVQQATSTPFTQWLNDKIFNPAGIADLYVLDQDRQGNFLATGGVRLSMSDWIRLGVYIQEQRDKNDCFGKFIQELGRTQVKIQKIPGINGYFNGYSYFTWTENDQAPNIAWAVGHNGQRIGWSSKQNNKKLFLTFGDGSDSDMGRIYPLANRWIN